MKDVTTHDISEKGELSGTERPVEIEFDLQKSVHMYIRNENERRLCQHQAQPSQPMQCVTKSLPKRQTNTGTNAGNYQFCAQS